MLSCLPYRHGEMESRGGTGLHTNYWGIASPVPPWYSSYLADTVPYVLPVQSFLGAPLLPIPFLKYIKKYTNNSSPNEYEICVY